MDNLENTVSVGYERGCIFKFKENAYLNFENFCLLLFKYLLTHFFFVYFASRVVNFIFN
jgi:hypothetical protein